MKMRLGVCLLLALGASAASACEDSDEPSGAGGNAGSGGAAGRAGTGGRAGGPSGGAGGAAGTGGGSAAGAGGTAGTGGVAGAGGGGAGGGGEAGTSGAAGAAGAGGAGGAGAAGAGGTAGGGGAAGSGGAGAGTVVSQVVAGMFHTCALVEGGEVRCWGANDLGQLGDGTTETRLAPVAVLASPGGPHLTGVQALALGEEHTCAVLAGGEVRCWGGNERGQIGDGTSENRSTPVPVLASPGGPPLGGVSAIASGSKHSCALVSGGELRCWGSNTFGSLGDGTNVPRHTPVPVLQAPGGPPLPGVEAVAAGFHHACALVAGGEARCWGSNSNGVLGDGTFDDRSTPVVVRASVGGPPLEGMAAIASGVIHNCALVAGGEVRCWGSNFEGQLGDGSLVTIRTTPVPVVLPGGAPLTGAAGLTLGGVHSCVRTGGGGAICWGSNSSGQLGSGAAAGSGLPATPVLVSPGGAPLSGVQGLSGGNIHTCAVLSGGEARCWGFNGAGALGDGTTTDRPHPVPVAF